MTILNENGEQEASPGAEEKDQNIFDIEKFDTRRLYQSIKLARRVFFWMAALQIFVLVFYFTSMREVSNLFFVGSTITFSALYLFCALYSNKEPFTAILIGLIAYSAVTVYDFVINTGNFFSITLVLKVMIISILVRAAFHANKLNRIKRMLGY